MLEYYWEEGIDEAGVDFLEDSDFATDYEYLLYNRWGDAANPYGQTINAFLVVEGWNVMLVLRLISIGVFLTVCIVSIATAVSHSFEIGLTAGSYAASLLSVMLAVFAFLSLII
ncbi:hypothetical protein EKO04_000015 [Ascochyta lentis]|uniref:Uncharacterized protein n=1 Tax=Ascochyta lentis TaxID=205686 RepID=A0A8H7MMF9_9PLEO|nr:hypothetical protein EKO04_000015 [Ascochyta lentis]